MGVGAGIGSGAASGAATGSMFGPWGTAIGAGIGAAAGGLTNYFGAKKQEEADKKESMRQLYNQMLTGGDMMQIGKPVEKADMAAEVGKPLLGAGISALGQINKQPKEGEVAPEWYESAAKGYLGTVK